MLSPRSRGKGSRRMPGREGGRRKAKAILPGGKSNDEDRLTWRKHAQHAVASLADLTEPFCPLVTSGFFGDSAADFIYKFDQCIAKWGLPYYAECTGRRHQWTFKVWVSSGNASDVNEIIARIRMK